MCQCTPEIRTPFCGKPGCERSKQTPPASKIDPKVIASLPQGGIVFAVELRQAGIDVEVYWQGKLIAEFPDRCCFSQVCTAYVCGGSRPEVRLLWV